MYAHVRGIVCEVLPDRAVIEANGVGYELFCSSLTLRELLPGKQAKLFTHFHIAQDAVALYGFYTNEERAMFRKLIGVSRIGPKLALAALSVLSPNDIAMAVLTDNAAAFDGVPGMGRKTAARVILELKEKVDGTSSASGGALQARPQSAVICLGVGIRRPGMPFSMQYRSIAIAAVAVEKVTIRRSCFSLITV